MAGITIEQSKAIWEQYRKKITALIAQMGKDIDAFNCYSFEDKLARKNTQEKLYEAFSCIDQAIIACDNQAKFETHAETFAKTLNNIK